MEILNLKEHSEITNFKTKVCVIGSGPAGGVVAEQIARENVDVLLLEAGGSYPDYSHDFIADIDCFSNVTDLRFGWSRQFGGSSNLWSGRTSPLEEIDFENRSWIPDSGWPFGMETLKPFYQQAANILELPKYQYFDNNEDIEQNIFDHILGVDTGLEAKCFQWSKSPFIVSDYLRKMSAHLSTLKVFLNAPVSRLQEKTDGSSVESVLVTRADGKSITIEACCFILAAGGIETPRLLLNSNQVKPDGIGNDCDTVGRYFSTHPKANMAAIILNKSVSTFDSFFMDRPLGQGSYRYGLGFSRELQERLELLNHYIQFSPLLEYQANRAFEIIKNTKVVNSSFIDSSQLMRGFLPGLGKIVFEAMGRIAKLQPRSKKFIMRGFLDQYPNRENRVMLSREQKADGTQKVDIQWSYSDNDKESVVRFFSYLDSIFQKYHVGRVDYSGLQKLEDWPLIGIHSHFMGTTRMGRDKKASVTDENARVRGTSNLYIAGPSLFPTYGFANPFLTITALSLKLAKHLKKVL